MASQARANKQPRKVCRLFADTGRCRYGANCKFPHEGAARTSHGLSSFAKQSQNAHQRPRNELADRFQTWKLSVPKSSNHLHFTPLPPLFFQHALMYVNGEVGMMQETIVTLAKEGGLQRIKQIVERDLENLGLEQRRKTIKEQVIPLFQVVANPHVLASTLLETHLGTIYNFIYGIQGHRAVRFFKPVFAVLADREQVDASSSEIEAVTTAFSKIVDCNTHAFLNEDLKLLADKLFDLVAALDEVETHESRKLVNRISERFGLGRQLSGWKPPKRTVPLTATFTLQQDLPGALSEAGPRHNNDHVNAFDIQIMPTFEEINAARPEYLPSMSQEDWHLPGVAGLLDRHFRLLREDTVGQLRDAVRQELHASHNSEKVSGRQGLRKLTYDNAHVVRLDFNKWQGLLVTLRFDQPPHLRQRLAKQRRDWWECQKRLRTDSLICLLSTHGTLLFCSVTEPRKPNTSGKEKGLSNPRDGLEDVQSENPRDLFTDPFHGFVTVSLVTESTDDVLELMKAPASSSAKIVEFPGVLLPSFEPTLRALQVMLRAPEVPFSEYIAPESDANLSEVAPPHYASKSDFQFDVSCIMKEKQMMKIACSDNSNHDAFRENSILDVAQADALLASLSRSLALIQGPPGTGKSFTGVAVIKVLLAMQSHAKLGPIICVCYTNHALDQLLEDLVRHSVNQIVRVGSQSKSEMLQNCNLRVLANKMELTRTEKQEHWNLKSNLENDENDILSAIRRLSHRGDVAVLKTYLEVYQPESYKALFRGAKDEEGFEKVVYNEKNLLNSWRRGGSRQGFVRSLQILLGMPIKMLNHAERQQLYNHWLAESEETARADILTALARYKEHKDLFDQVRANVDLRCLQQAEVIGVTTTGLARILPLLRKLKSKVLVCEEAGEVLEAHILTALLPSLEHAILIGDQLQLPPKSSYELSRESSSGKRYSLDVSLFERLVTPSCSMQTAMPYSTLETQRRMHPSISELIRSTLYPRLRDSPMVQLYPPVTGMARRLFWLDHTYPEDGSTADVDNTTSHSNTFEVEMVTALVSHLVRQGVYHSDDLAILTPYLGQLQKIRRVLQRSFEISLTEGDILELEKQEAGKENNDLNHTATPPLQKTPLSRALKVSTIDNFQGEEAKVVIISLVRSNEQNKCGFLRTPNRINVLLSRAKHGMYIIGNSRTSGHVQMWASVIEILQSSDNFGDALQLRCPRHEAVLSVSKPDDFSIFSPEGGCDLPCEWRLGCGHACISKCHSKILHSAVKCLEPCPRPLKECEHLCPNYCGDKCPVKCEEELSGLITLPCGHTRDTLPCWQARDPSKVICQDKVTRIVPGCKHHVELPCYVNVEDKKFNCRARCGAARQCGHVCIKPCNMCKTREDGRVASEDHRICNNICGRPYKCKHRCQAICHGESDCPPCQASCEVSCFHSKCTRLCYEQCIPCAEQTCPSSCPHSTCTLPCAAPCNWLPCSKRCLKLLQCGHQCPSVCGEICPSPKYCQVCASQDIKGMVVDLLLMEEYHEINLDENPCIIPPCGHILTVESMDGQMEMSKHYATESGTAVGIADSAVPFSKDELKVCSSCRGPLRTISRYGRIVRRGLIDEATKKFITSANQRFIPLYESVHRHESELAKSVTGVQPAQRKVDSEPVTLSGGIKEQLEKVLKVSSHVKRYSAIIKTRNRLLKYLQQVDIEEQPFKRVWDLVQFARKQGKAGTDAALDPTAIQTSQTLQGKSLLARCELAILSDFLTIFGPHLADVGLQENREDCLRLLAAAQEANRPIVEAEAHIYHVQYCIAERTYSNRTEQAGRLSEDARQHLTEAKRLCSQYAGQTAHLTSDLQSVEEMVESSTFTTRVRDDEWRAVMAAMAREFRGSGHWYTCRNGHPFTVGECGMPMESTRCSACGAPVGGQRHTPAEGVQHARDLERRFGEMRL